MCSMDDIRNDVTSFWAHLPSGIKAAVSPNRKELYTSNFTARKLNSCFIKMCNKNWY